MLRSCHTHISQGAPARAEAAATEAGGLGDEEEDEFAETEKGRKEKKGEAAAEEEEQEEEQEEVDTSGMSETQRRLFQLKMKLNQVGARCWVVSCGQLALWLSRCPYPLSPNTHAPRRGTIVPLTLTPPQHTHTHTYAWHPCPSLHRAGS